MTKIGYFFWSNGCHLCLPTTDFEGSIPFANHNIKKLKSFPAVEGVFPGTESWETLIIPLNKTKVMVLD